MVFSSGIAGAASHLLGASFAGARNTLPTDGTKSSGVGRAIDTFFGAADVFLNGESTNVGNGMLAATLKSGLATAAGAIGVGSLGRPGVATLSWQTQVKDSFLQGLLADAKAQQAQARAAFEQARGTAGEAQARATLEQATRKVDDLSVTRLQMVATSRQQDLVTLTATLQAQMPQASRLASFLDGDLDPRSYRPRPGEEQAFSQRLMVDLSVGVARLDYLDAQIKVLDYQIAQGLASPEARAKLATLRGEFTSLRDRVAQLRSVGLGDVADKVERREALRSEYAKTEQRVVHVVEAVERTTGTSLVDDRPIDWSSLRGDELRAHLKAVGEKVRTENRQTVDTGDASWQLDRAEAMQQAILDDLRRDRARDARNERARAEQRDYQRLVDASVADRRAWWGRHDADVQRLHMQKQAEFAAAQQARAR